MADVVLVGGVLVFMLLGVPLMGRLDGFLERVLARWDKNV